MLIFHHDGLGLCGRLKAFEFIGADDRQRMTRVSMNVFDGLIGFGVVAKRGLGCDVWIVRCQGGANLDCVVQR